VKRSFGLSSGPLSQLRGADCRIGLQAQMPQTSEREEGGGSSNQPLKPTTPRRWADGFIPVVVLALRIGGLVLAARWTVAASWGDAWRCIGGFLIFVAGILLFIAGIGSLVYWLTAEASRSKHQGDQHNESAHIFSYGAGEAAPAIGVYPALLQPRSEMQRFYHPPRPPMSEQSGKIPTFLAEAGLSDYLSATKQQFNAVSLTINLTVHRTSKEGDNGPPYRP
jgi:hypothetical protein